MCSLIFLSVTLQGARSRQPKFGTTQLTVKKHFIHKLNGTHAQKDRLSLYIFCLHHLKTTL